MFPCYKRSGVAVVAGAVLVLGLAGCESLPRATAWDAQARDATVMALESGDCAEVWARAWPAAKAGRQDALLVVGGAMYAQGLTPPGGNTDVLSQLRATMAVYGQVASSGDTHARELLAALLADDFFDGGDGKAHAACLLQSGSPGQCVAAADAAGLLMTFPDYAAEVDALAARATTPATCSRPIEPASEALPQPIE